MTLRYWEHKVNHPLHFSYNTEWGLVCPAAGILYLLYVNHNRIWLGLEIKWKWLVSTVEYFWPSPSIIRLLEKLIEKPNPECVILLVVVEALLYPDSQPCAWCFWFYTIHSCFRDFVINIIRLHLLALCAHFLHFFGLCHMRIWAHYAYRVFTD